jgi:hypothetical protein
MQWDLVRWVVAQTPLGYPDESPAAKDRKPMADMVSWEKW